MKFITKEYLETQKELHSRPDGYGGNGYKWLGHLLYFMGQNSAKTLLDFGCGEASVEKFWKCVCGKSLNGLEITSYDPAIETLSKLPVESFDIINVTDVMEHIEEKYTDEVLDWIANHSNIGAFFVIATRLANKTLSDGRNAHINMKDQAYWTEQLFKRFEKISLIKRDGELVYECLKAFKSFKVVNDEK